MQPRSKKGPSWRDSDALPAPSAKASSSTSQAKSSDKGDVDDETPDAPPESEATSDMDWLKRHMKSSLDISESANKDFVQSDEEMEGAAEEPPKSTPQDDTKNIILQTGRLFLRNLAFTCTDEELLDLFKPFGEVAQVSINFHFLGDLLALGMTNLDRDIRASAVLILYIIVE